jgi:hypothetical protein
MSTFDESPYTLRKNRYDFERDAQRAANEYGRFVSQRRFNRGYENLLRGFDRQRDRLPNAFAARGVMNSGIFQNALGRYAQDRLDGTNDALSSQQEAERMFDMRNAEIDQRWNSNMLDLEAEKQARIRALASQLADLKQFGA